MWAYMINKTNPWSRIVQHNTKQLCSPLSKFVDVIESTSCRQEYNGSQCCQLKRADLLNKENNGPFSQSCAVRTSGLLSRPHVLKILRIV